MGGVWLPVGASQLGSRKVPCAPGAMSVGEAVPSPSPRRDLSTDWAQAG